MRSVRRIVPLAALAILALALAAGGANAALWLLFSRTTAEPGDTVVVRTGGRGALLVAKRRGDLRRWPLRVFAVSKADAESVRSPRDARLSPLGRLSVDRNGDGRLRFVVPNLPAGDYTTLVHCVSCARYSNGRTLVPGGPTRRFRVRPGFRSCRSSVYSELDPGWEGRSVRAGPLWLVRIHAYPPRMFEPPRGLRYRVVKVPIVVEDGSTVTLKVPAEMHGKVGIEYDPDSPFRRGSRRARVRDAGYSVTFEGCPPNEGFEGPYTLFTGAFVVAGPICARLEVTVAGRAEPLSFAAPLGGSC